MNKYYDQNSRHWDNRARVHSSKSSDFYNIEEFLNGKSTLLPLEKSTLGNIKGKKILHAQCHIGFDTISLARMGAEVTGVDFSLEAIRKAKEFAYHLQTQVTFIQSNIFDLPKTELPENSFDIVYASYGVLCWIDDLSKWTATLSKYLKPGGMFLLIDDHPYVSTIELENNKYEIKYNYFKNPEPFEFIVENSYTGEKFKLDVKKSYEWNHSIDEIIMSFLKSGLSITSFYEYDFNFWQRFPFLTKSSEGFYYKDSNKKNIPEYKIPLMFSLTATK